jgi:hypothetical protein
VNQRAPEAIVCPTRLGLNNCRISIKAMVYNAKKERKNMKYCQGFRNIRNESITTDR